MGESEEKAADISLKDQGNVLFKAGNYLKAAALYTQAIKQDPSNHTLYSTFLHLVKLNKALSDADKTISLKPDWEKGYFRKGCVLEAMERYEDAVAAFQVALKYNPQSFEVSKKIKRLTQLARDKKRAEEVDIMRSNVNMAKHLDSVKNELSGKYGSGDFCQEIFSFLVQTMEGVVRSWHENSTVDPRAYFLLQKDKTDTEKYPPVVNIDKAFESPHTHSSCSSFLRQYAEDSFSLAACVVAPKSIISYPQVWKGEGSRKWKHGQNDGFFFQFESPSLRKIWFVPSSNEKGQMLCRDPVALDIGVHEIIHRVFKEA
ncbi:hypothetical protein OROHE_016519 [Orobanche hederae]